MEFSSGENALGAKAPVSVHPCGTTEQAAEKWRSEGESAEKLPSGPKGRADFDQLAARVNSCPFKTPSFSAACEVVPFQNRIHATSSTLLRIFIVSSTDSG